MEGDFIKVNKWLRPLSCLYGMGVGVRNYLFDMGILKSRKFDLPVISIGNLTVGGTGKTPHTEYLIELLKDRYNVAVLSRGYKRKSSGFILSKSNTSVQQIGDEPYQMKQKFPDIEVAVDKDRCHGIEKLLEHDNAPDTDVILLDDAYQHRYVSPGLNILLVDYHRLACYDELLPAGRLREPFGEKNRANIVIITKCPTTCKPIDYRVVTKAMDLYPFQRLFFSTLEYGELVHVYNGSRRALSDIRHDEILLLTGIASPEQLIHDLKKHNKHIHPLSFPDHHNFSSEDIKTINESFANIKSDRKIVITTEKDACRLKTISGLSKEICDNLYIIPVKIVFLRGQQDVFNEKIIEYVRKNPRNGSLAKSKDAHTSDHSYYSGNRLGAVGYRD